MPISYTSLNPDSMDGQVQLLGKILQRLGSFAQTGDTPQTLLARILTSLNNSSAASATYVAKAGDTMTGPLILPSGGAGNTSLRFGGSTNSSPALRDMGLGVPPMLGARAADDSVASSFQAGFIWAIGEDANNSTQPVCIEAYHNITGGAGGGAVNAGSSIDLSADSATVDRRTQCRLSTLWTDATDVTRTAQLRIQCLNSGTTQDVLRISAAGVDLRNQAPLLIGGGPYFNPVAVYASGTAYTLTATSAAVVFGTTSPATALGAFGTYRIRARVKVALNGATFAANQTLTLKLRRTNNTPTDLGNSSTTWIVPIMTTITNTLAIIELPEIFYVGSSSTDNITIFADISVLPSAGSITISEASLHLVRLTA